MPINTSFEQKQQKYLKARTELDNIFTDFNGKTSPLIKDIVDYKAYSILSLIREWVGLYHNGIRGFADVVDFTSINSKLGKSLSQYTKYVYNYRFCNNLANNILFRKILSFEMYFLSKNEVLRKKKTPDIGQVTDNEALFYLSPLGHFMFYRVQKEFHLRSNNLAQAHRTVELYEEILTILRINLHEFFSNYTDTDGKIHSQDDFRKFLGLANNKNLLSIIEYIERNLKVNI